MAQFNVQQVAAPDFSGIGDLLRGANQSFNNAFTSANSILGQYQEGQQAKADAAFLENVANVGNEQQLADFFIKNPRFAEGLSPDMMKTAAALRDTVLGYGTTRANTDSVTSATARANAQEGRTAADWTYGNNARDALNALTPAFMSAYMAGQTYGQPAVKPVGPITGSTMQPDANRDRQGAPTDSWLQYENQGAVRNEPLAQNLVGALSFVGDMGLTMKVFSGGQESNKPGEGTGSTRHNHGMSGDVAFYDNTGRMLDWNNPQDLPVLQQVVSQARANGVTGIGAGNDYMGAGRFHMGYGDPAVWGAGGKSANAPEWLKAAYASGSGVSNAGGAIPGPTGYVGGQYNGYLQSPQMQAAFAAINGNKFLSPEVGQALADALIGSTKAGQDNINARDAAQQAELAAGAQLAAIQNPNLISLPGQQSAVLGAPGLSASTALKAAGDLAGVAGPGGVLSAVASPQMPSNAAADSLAAAATDRNNNNLNTDPSTVALRNYETNFKNAEDPVKVLDERYNASRSFFTADSNIQSDPLLMEGLQKMADEAKVSLPEMAATLDEMSKPNSKWDRAFGTVSPQAYIQRYINGTLETYGGDPIGEAVKKFGPGAHYAQDTAKAATAGANQDLTMIQTQIGNLQSKREKLRLADPSSPEIAKLTGQINDLTTQLNGLASPAAAVRNNLMLLPKDSPQYAEQLKKFGELIDADPTIDASKKVEIKKSWDIK